MIGLLRRDTGVPASLRKRLQAHERVLAVGDADADAVVATQLGLWLPEPGRGESAPGWRRIGWESVVLATWTDDGLRVIEGVRDANGIVTDLAPVTQALSVPRNVPAVVRQRVEGSIARWEQVRVPGGTARLVARRVPGQDGLTWTARLDGETPDGPAARAVLVGHLDQILATAAQQGDL